MTKYYVYISHMHIQRSGATLHNLNPQIHRAGIFIEAFTNIHNSMQLENSTCCMPQSLPCKFCLLKTVHVTQTDVVTQTQAHGKRCIQIHTYENIYTMCRHVFSTSPHTWTWVSFPQAAPGILKPDRGFWGWICAHIEYNNIFNYSVPHQQRC